MNSPGQRPPKHWSHWVGRLGVWTVGAVGGFFAGVLLAGVLQARLTGLVTAALIGASLLATAWAGSSLPLPGRDLLIGLGLGQLGGAGFATYVLGALPNC